MTLSATQMERVVLVELLRKEIEVDCGEDGIYREVIKEELERLEKVVGSRNTSFSVNSLLVIKLRSALKRRLGECNGVGDALNRTTLTKLIDKIGGN